MGRFISKKTTNTAFFYPIKGDLHHIDRSYPAPAPSSTAGTTGSHRGVENNGAFRGSDGEKWKMTLGH